MTARKQSYTGGPVRLLIVGHVRLHREALAARLESREEVAVTGIAAGRIDALQRLDQVTPDIVLVDAALPERLDLIRDLRRNGGLTKAITVAVADVATELVEGEDSGGSAYVTAGATVEELVLTIRRIAGDVRSD